MSNCAPPAMSKEQKIGEMNQQLVRLQQQMATFAKLSQESAQQFELLKRFGIQQSSFFMSSHSVFQRLNEEREGGSREGAD